MLKTKKLLSTIAFALLSLFGISQENNPYNQRGIDYVTSINTISADFDAGIVTEINEQTLRQYSISIPLQNEVSTELASTIVTAMKSGNFDFRKSVNESSLSTVSQATLIEIFYNPNRLELNDYRNLLILKVDEIVAAELPKLEKEFILSMVAISYNAASNPSMRSSGCDFQINGVNQPVNPWECAVLGAVIGGVLGFQACGPWCALGGAVIGGLIFGLS